MTAELLPCPFCGGTDLQASSNGIESCFFGCGCGAEGPTCFTHVEALEAWNRRAQPPAGEVAKDAGWRDIESAPKGRKLIVGYPNELGNWRTVMACYYCEGELPQPDDYDDEFAPPGWYEESESHENILATDETPTHWMPLPAPPVLPTKE